MNKLGIRVHDLGKKSFDEAAKSIKENGFSGVQLVFSKAINEHVDFTGLELF